MLRKLNQPVLVTGSTGFIGSNLVRELLNKKINPHIIVRDESNLWRIKDIIKNTQVHYADLINFTEINSLVKKIKPRTIFHLAAYGAYAFQNDKELIKSSILDSTINFLDICAETGFDVFINTGSNSEYGFMDHAMSEVDTLKPNSYYSVFKSAATLYCQYTSIEKRLPIITVRPFHVYGPYEENTRLIPVLVNHLLNNKCPPLVDPDISRDLIYINDVIELLLLIAQNPTNNGDIFNIGSGKQYTIKEIFDITSELIGANIKPKWNTMKNRSWDQKKWVSDMTKVKTVLNWEPNISLKQGLSDFIQWSKNNY